jgi:hypothetical protein
MVLELSGIDHDAIPPGSNTISDTGHNSEKGMADAEPSSEELPTDPSGDQRLYRDSAVLERWYNDEGASLSTIGDRLGCATSTVGYWMDEHGIERRDASAHKRCEPAHFRTHQGYERWYTTVDGTTRSVLVHRLLAVSESGLDAIRGKHVHHVNGIGWDNRPANPELLAPTAHLRREAEGRLREGGKFVSESGGKRPGVPHRRRSRETATWNRERYEHAWRDPELLRDLYVEREFSAADIADRIDCCTSTVLRWLERHGIQRRSLSEAQLVRVRREPVRFETRPPDARDAGYEFWHYQYRRRDDDGEQGWIPVHRLPAVAEFGFEATRGCDVHHANGIRWDNRPENITLLSPERHALLTRIRENRDGTT